MNDNNNNINNVQEHRSISAPPTSRCPTSSPIMMNSPISINQGNKSNLVCHEHDSNVSDKTQEYLNGNGEKRDGEKSTESRWHQTTLAKQSESSSCDATEELLKLVAELGNSDPDTSVDLKNVCLHNNLLYCNRELLKLKDFSSEVRASMDVEQFVHQAELILDMTEVSVDKIISVMLDKVMSNDKVAAKEIDEAKKVIYVPNSSTLLARTIQGMSSLIDTSGRPTYASYDQSWLCALCSLGQVSRRHMVVARFKHPIDMADNAHEVRLFALMVVPTKEKDTKSALETGRTFATLLTHAAFRKQLLEAKSELEFKSLMMIKAHQLSKSKKALKNRYKYMLGPALNKSITSLSESSNNIESVGGQWQKSIATTCLSNEKLNSFSSSHASSIDIEQQTKPNKSNQLDACNLFSRNQRTSDIIDFIAQVDSYELNKPPSLHHSESIKPNEVDTLGISDFGRIEFGKGLWDDFRRRMDFYVSDFRDAIIGPPKTVQKTIATIWFLYFGILLPTIAFSALNTNQTHGHMGDLRKAIIGQAIGGLGFALFGGQPLVIIMTTAPLCLYTKVIHQMCLDYGFHFPAMYAAVGLWNGFFLCIYSLLGFSRLMKWCTRSTEEIFALFIVIAFISDASKDLVKNFRKYYYTPACDGLISNATTVTSQTIISSANETITEISVCKRETSLLFVLLMLGTLWLATTLYKFRRTRYLEASRRELLADYALPAAVIIMSFVGSYVFDDIYVERFPPLADINFQRAEVELLPLSGVFTSLGLGFTLSLLFFMDQNISAAMVDSPQNGLKKGSAYHFDLFVVAILNGFLTLYGLPMMHGVLPHSPLHVRSLADIEERVDDGHSREVIINVRETRVTGIVSHILVLLSLYLIPYPIAYIPTAVLNGLFLYMAVTSMDGLQIFERIQLLFTEQSKYPPNHYLRRCPQRKIHQFTMLQLIQLLVMCLFGFSPFNIVEMFFPLIILLMIPFRHRIVPKFINEKYLDALDGKHC